MNHTSTSVEDPNLVEAWLRRDVRRWIAGGLAGMFATAVMVIFSMIVCKIGGGDPWLLLKIAALPCSGAAALNADAGMGTLLKGLALLGLVCTFFGVIYAHFTGATNRFLPLLGMGFTWGAFAWIFINNLFMMSWRDIFVADVNLGAAFFVWQAYGISLVSVKFFDRIVRGK